MKRREGDVRGGGMSNTEGKYEEGGDREEEKSNKGSGAGGGEGGGEWSSGKPYGGMRTGGRGVRG